MRQSPPIVSTCARALPLLARYFVLGFLLCAGSALLAHDIAAAEGDKTATPQRFIAASSNNFPPINSLDEDGELTGFGLDLAQAVIAATGAEVVNIHSGDWPEVLEWLETGETDFIHDTGYAPDRESYLDFSAPIISMPESIFVRSNTVDIHDFDSLKGKKVACVDRQITHLYLHKFPHIDCHIVKKPIEGLYALLNEEVDAYIYPEQIVLYFAQKLHLAKRIKIVGEPLRNLTWHMTVKRGNTAMLERLNLGIERVRESGEYNRIYKKWFGRSVLLGYSTTEVVFYAVGATTIAVFAVGAMLLLLFTWRMRRARKQLSRAAKDLSNTKKALEENEIRFSTMFEEADIGIAIVSPDGYFLQTNRKLLETLGYSENELKALRFDKFTHPDDLDKNDHMREEALRGGTDNFQMEKRYIRKDGSIVWANVSTALVHDDEGAPAYFISFIEDITERKAVQSALLEREHRIAGIMENAPDALITIDEDGIIESFNPAAEEIFGFTREEAQGQPVSIIIPSPDADKHGSYIKRHLKTGEGMFIGQGPRELPAKRRDGSAFPISIAISAMNLDGRNIFIAAMRDITAEKQAERELRKAKEEAEKGNKTKTEFLAMMSHELRTPLNAVIGFAEVMRDQLYGPIGSEKYSQYANDIWLSGRHLLDIINEILDLAKIESGKWTLSPDWFELDRAVQQCFRLIKGHPEAGKVKLDVNIEPGINRLHGDELAFRQILLNLLSNAAKFTDYSGHIQVEARHNPSGGLDILVKDDGIGIPEDMLEKITEPFTQVESPWSRQYEGTGLGLSLSKALAELHGGSLSIASEVGKGTNVTLHLPESCLTGMSEISNAS